MKQKFKNLFNFLYRYSIIWLVLLIWQIMASLAIIPEFLLPSPYSVIKAFIDDFSLIMYHTKYTLLETFIGISIAIVLAFLLSILMDTFKICYDILYPPIIITQTIPTIAIAPLLIIWLGYHMTPKIVLIVLTGFFPILIALIDGYRSVDKDSLTLLKSMGATKWQTYRHAKLPASLGYFFAGLRVSISYALISAVVSEWLGGFYGLGVYMTRVRKAFALDKMFAIIFFVSILSLVLMAIINYIHKKVVKY
ncbi:nitrate/sulfonate/bicarbonate ABC transporter, permease protein [Campylobacter pinnipediorum subsp. pinnipediorum]|uniref:Nitrate ABC transporter permease n=2 Tax=Campylobacter TaxID=194 RepID=A0AAX0L9J2_9BACT|nr:nitrate/sulfonate/bicarbonate ABC transporter, permease protein [Campylobacter pinnipediorum subsp. pinnipediorum]OPA77305.1 nitrate ABC transporter permease [Campylobacter pinnipediorum subsp. pinnipediorum]OPA78232.1 nitrate ABC transporter permease [Campylobacter pinnipediorum subsp. pinnipediorum]